MSTIMVEVEIFCDGKIVQLLECMNYFELLASLDCLQTRHKTNPDTQHAQ